MSSLITREARCAKLEERRSGRLITKHTSMVSTTTVVRGWLIILTLFEVVELAELAGGGSALTGMGSNLAARGDHKAEIRLWSFMLVLLVISRVTAVHSPHSSAVRFQLAAVHVAEMLYMGSEFNFQLQRQGCDICHHCLERLGLYWAGFGSTAELQA